VIDEDSKGAADRFIKKLKNSGFKMSRSKNDAENYGIHKQRRDSKATDEFTKSQLFKDIIEYK